MQNDFQLRCVPRRISFAAKFYLLFGGPAGVCAAIFLTCSLFCTLFFYANRMHDDLFYSVQPAQMTAKVVRLSPLAAKIQNKTVWKIDFVWKDEQNQEKNASCFTFTPLETGAERPLEAAGGAFRMEGTSFGIFGLMKFKESLLALILCVFFWILAVATFVAHWVYGKRTIHLLRNAPFYAAKETHRAETGTRINRLIEYRITYEYSDSDSEDSVPRQTQVKTLRADLLDPEVPQPILADERGRSLLCADLWENLTFRSDASFGLQPSRLVSVVFVLFLVGLMISSPLFF